MDWFLYVKLLFMNVLMGLLALDGSIYFGGLGGGGRRRRSLAMMTRHR